MPLVPPPLAAPLELGKTSPEDMVFIKSRTICQLVYVEMTPLRRRVTRLGKRHCRGSDRFLCRGGDSRWQWHGSVKQSRFRILNNDCCCHQAPLALVTEQSRYTADFLLCNHDVSSLNGLPCMHFTKNGVKCIKTDISAPNIAQNKILSNIT